MPVVQTAELDNFDRAPEPQIEGDETNPLSGIRPPWYMTPWAVGNPELKNTTYVDPAHPGNGTMAGTEFPNAHVSAYLRNRVLWGPRVQTWGVQSGSAALADTWRFGLWTVASVENNLPAGFQCLPWDAIGGDVFLLRIYDGGGEVYSESPGETLGGDGSICVMNYDEDSGALEVWHSVTGLEADFDLINSVSWPGLTGPWFVHYGMTGVETGWDRIGGGTLRRTQIYRYVRPAARQQPNDFTP